MKSFLSLIKSPLFTVFFASAWCAGALTACSTSRVLVGTVQPVETGSATAVPDISKKYPHWKKISGNPDSPDSSDAAWQSEVTAAVISIDSACREHFDGSIELKSITQNLLSEWGELKINSEKNLTVSGHTAMETIAQGKYQKRTRKFNITTLKSQHCIYDLVFLSPVESFDQDLSVFKEFRDSLNLK